MSKHAFWGLRRIVLAATVASATAAAVVAMPASGAPYRLARPSGPGRLRAVCRQARPGDMRCDALYRPQYAVNAALNKGRSARPAGLTPQQIRAAYRLPARGGAGQTVAVSIAYHAPHLAQYLAHYRSWFHLPACTTTSGCLRIVNQHGRPGPLPRSGVATGWALEETLDVSMISVACPGCHILVVEGDSPSPRDLGATENTAARLGAQVISNSYGQRESGFSQATAADYRHPGHTVVASAGDFGFTAAQFPASLATVTAVGGTELTRAPRTRRGWAEQVLNQPGGAGGSGCSAYVAKPAWQHDSHCPGRTVGDVSAVGWNVPVYNKDFGGWITLAGTSVSAPLIAGTYALAGNAATIKPGYTYAHPRALFDITRGSNAWFGTPAQLCGGDYLCVAGKGYDAPTGLGTPDGTGSF